MAAPIMADDLRQLLLANMVPQECVDLLQKDGCINLKLFSKWAPDRAAMQSLVLDKVPSHKISVQALASLLQTHDEATSIVTEMTKRTSAGLDPSSMDEPLLHAVQQALEAKLTQKYSWQLEPKYQPSNSVLGRIKREFDKNAPTIFNVCRVKTVFTSNKIQEPKRRRVGTGITLTFEEDLDDEDPQALKYRQIMHKYNVLALAWAIAGNFEVTYEGSKCDFASCDISALSARRPSSSWTIIPRSLWFGTSCRSRSRSEVLQLSTADVHLRSLSGQPWIWL